MQMLPNLRSLQSPCKPRLMPWFLRRPRFPLKTPPQLDLRPRPLKRKHFVKSMTSAYPGQP